MGFAPTIVISGRAPFFAPARVDAERDTAGDEEEEEDDDVAVAAVAAFPLPLSQPWPAALWPPPAPPLVTASGESPSARRVRAGFDGGAAVDALRWTPVVGTAFVSTAFVFPEAVDARARAAAVQG